MKKKHFLLSFAAIALSISIFSSCKKESITLNTDGSDTYQPYMPLNIGKYIVYDIDSSIWNDVKCIKYSYTYQHKYLVADTFRDAQNRLSYVINIYSRKAAKDAFVVDNVIYYTPAAEKLELVENNLRFIRLTNPVGEGKTWLGNSLVPSEDHDYDFLKGWRYKYENVLKPFDNGARTFDKTITVIERDSILNNPEIAPNTFASLQQSKSVYAYAVGMVYHSYSYWTYDPIPGQQNCRKGVGVVMRAIEYN